MIGSTVDILLDKGRCLYIKTHVEVIYTGIGKESPHAALFQNEAAE